MSLPALLPSEFQTSHDAAVACVKAAERLSVLNDSERREALRECREALGAALSPVDAALSRVCDLTISRNWHRLVYDLADDYLRVADLPADCGGRIISLAWDAHWPLRPRVLIVELEREMLAASPAASPAKSRRGKADRRNNYLRTKSDEGLSPPEIRVHWNDLPECRRKEIDPVYYRRLDDNNQTLREQNEVIYKALKPKPVKKKKTLKRVKRN